MPSPHRDPLGQLRADLAADPAHAAVLVDFDGTLAPIVTEPRDAVADPAVVAALDALVGRIGRVAVVSGRPLSFLVDRLGSGIDLSALYGLESRIDGVVATHPDVETYRPRIEAAARAASARFAEAGVSVEFKGLSLTIHFRQVPEAGSAVHDWASTYASDASLQLRPAKASVELHPPIAVDKGTVVHDLAVDCRTVAYFGDDVGDLAAFGALDELRAAGLSTCKVAVRSTELPHVLEHAADVVIDGPDAVAAFLTGLAASL